MRAVCLCLFVLLASLSLPSPTGAHSLPAGALPPDGLRIAGMTHGEMAVFAPFRAGILDLADRHYPPDDTLRRLTNYARIQFTYCLWGLMPGTVTAETSPFNVCAHAYLAATRDVLLRLRVLSGADPAVSGLASRIDEALLLNGSALVLCQHSADAFSTAQVIGPDWSLLPGHPPTLIVLALGLAIALGLAAWLLIRWPRRAGG